LKAAALLVLAATLCAGAALGDPANNLDRLSAAYPNALAAPDGNTVVFHDGTRMDAGSDDPAKSFDARIANATIADMFHLAYPQGAPIAAPPRDFDPGRFRNKAFFDKLYGDCRKNEVESRLTTITWLPKSWGHAVRVTSANGVAAHLTEVSDEIERLPPEIRAAAFPIAGVYACRAVADNGQPSMHAYAAAIDLNLKYSAYWLWAAKHGSDIPYSNRMPREIVDIFERHGFIWGGRWYHYDTMHFEYRPELLAPATGPR
jgi:hypothetical protein